MAQIETKRILYSCTVYSTVQYSTVQYYSDGKGQCGGTIGAVIYLNKAQPLEKANIQV